MFPGDPIQQAFVKRPKGGPLGTPQAPAQFPEQQGQYPNHPGGASPPACDPCDILGALYHLIGSSPDYYPWREDIMTRDSKAFDEVGTIGIPAIADGETIVTSLTCPAGYDGIVLGISNNVLGAPSFNPQLPSLIWRIRNGVSINNSLFVDGYSAITVEFGESKFPRPTCGIFVSSGQTLLYTITNNDPTIPIGSTAQTICCLRGKFWPVQRQGR